MASLTEQQQQVIELVGTLAANLSGGQTIRHVSFTGRSMLPMLRQRKDSVELIKAPPRLKKYDLPMYIGPRGKYVMHRIVDVKDDCYICLGDNTYAYEHVRPEWMIARVSAFKRGDHRIPVENPGYRLYARVWVALFPLRRFLRKGRIWLGKYLRPVKQWLRRHLK